jgi:hypothetical protein
MNRIRTNKLYNYLVNTYGLSKEVVFEYIDTRLEDLIGKHLEAKLDSNYIERLILNRITRIAEEGISNGSYYYERDNFEVYVTKCLNRILSDKVNNEYTIESKMVKKGDKVVKVRKKK